jgi:pimeloyl-[acyl-carrier protein] methyl ester esterase
MSIQLPKLILLPGMDGTGELYKNFANALPRAVETEVLRYPADRFLSYEQLASFVEPATSIPEPFVLVAESFSTPLAIQLAATNPPNLKGIVICAGFITSPARDWLFPAGSFLSTALFHRPLPEFAAKWLLIGRNASRPLLVDLRAAVSSVKPQVLSARIRAVLACDMRAELEQVAVPILYIQAGQDRLVGKSCLEEIRRIKPNTVVTVISGPHLLFQCEPQRTANRVVEFIQKLV